MERDLGYVKSQDYNDPLGRPVQTDISSLQILVQLLNLKAFPPDLLY